MKRKYTKQWGAFASGPNWQEYILPKRTKAEFEKEGKAQAEIIQEMIPKGTETVLEFGCGIGRVLRHIQADNLVGVDTCMEFLLKAPEHIQKVHSEGANIKLRNSTADFIYSLMVFQHIAKEDHEDILTELYRILKPGGKMVIQFPKAGGKYYTPSHFVNTYTDEEIEYLFSYLVGVEYEIEPGNLYRYADGFAPDGEYREWFVTVEKNHRQHNENII